jgi:hypothetical protein
MSEHAPHDQAKQTDAAGRRRRWWQFGLRALLFLVLLIALGLLACRQYLKPYWRQQQTVALVEKLGGTCQTTEVSQWWLRLAGSAQNVTQVNLADCDDPNAYVAEVAELPAIELLIVGGPAFTDEHARRFHGLGTLRGLILDCTRVSDEELTALREALSDTEVYVSQRRAIAALGKVGVMGPLVVAASSLRDLAGDEWFQAVDDWFVARETFCDADAIRLGMLIHLRRLKLRGTQLTDAGLERLKSLKQLTALDLSRTEVSDAGLSSLQALGRLEYLSLEETKATDAGLKHLEGLSQLVEINLYGSHVTETGIANLADALPNCSVLGP